MVREPATGKYCCTRLSVLTLGLSWKPVRFPYLRHEMVLVGSDVRNYWRS
jgi:hypothetical protein